MAAATTIGVYTRAKRVMKASLRDLPGIGIFYQTDDFRDRTLAVSLGGFYTENTCQVNAARQYFIAHSQLPWQTFARQCKGIQG